MGTFLVVIVVLALVAGVVLNKRAASAAAEGVEFDVAAPADAVTDTIRAAYCSGAKAAAKSMLTGISVRQTGPGAFDVTSKLGDVSCIEIEPTGPRSTTVRARTSTLYIGSHPSSHFRNGFLAIGAVLTHSIFTMLGIAPGASRMNRVQRGIESRVTRGLERSARA